MNKMYTILKLGDGWAEWRHEFSSLHWVDPIQKPQLSADKVLMMPKSNLQFLKKHEVTRIKDFTPKSLENKCCQAWFLEEVARLSLITFSENGVKHKKMKLFLTLIKLGQLR